MKRFISLLLCIVMVLSLTCTAFAEETQTAAEAPLDEMTFFPPTEAASTEAANVTTYDVTSITKMITADGKKWINFPIADANGSTISGQTPTSCKSSDTTIATAVISGGQCVVSPKKAGFFNLTVSNSTYATIWHVCVQFTDVTKTSDAFYYPVYWALNYGITTGKTNTTFQPYANCTRAQIVTFLYRSMNES